MIHVLDKQRIKQSTARIEDLTLEGVSLPLAAIHSATAIILVDKEEREAHILKCRYCRPMVFPLDALPEFLSELTKKMFWGSEDYFRKVTRIVTEYERQREAYKSKEDFKESLREDFKESLRKDLDNIEGVVEDIASDLLSQLWSLLK